MELVVWFKMKNELKKRKDLETAKVGKHRNSKFQRMGLQTTNV